MNQGNRYLGSPYVIRETGFGVQMPFQNKTPIGGKGYSETKENISIKPQKPEQPKEKEENN